MSPWLAPSNGVAERGGSSGGVDHRGSVLGAEQNAMMIPGELPQPLFPRACWTLGQEFTTGGGGRLGRG